MISYLKGRLVQKKPPFLVIDVNDIGYECQAPMSTFYQLPECDQSILVYTHFAVREDAHSLYAFGTESERALFRALIKVSNVGPKLALAILSGIEAADFIRCIQEQDTSTLTHVPGVGKKTAERLIVELRDRLGDSGFETAKKVTFTEQDLTNKIIQEGVGALIALGFKPQEASRLIGSVKADYDSTEDLIRLALQATASGSR